MTATTLPPFTGAGALVAVLSPDSMDDNGNSPLSIMANEVDGDEIDGTMLPYDENQASFEATTDDLLAELGYRRVSQWSREAYPTATVEAL